MSEICRAFRNTGRCRDGDECPYEHSEGPAIRPPPCREFTAEGSCRYGERCRHLHGEDDARYNADGTRKKKERVPKERAPNEDGDSKPRERKADVDCNNYLEGRCTNGDKCRRNHPGNVAQVHAPLFLAMRRVMKESDNEAALTEAQGFYGAGAKFSAEACPLRLKGGNSEHAHQTMDLLVQGSVCECAFCGTQVCLY